jgi:methionyl-tRNA formyltransferase
MSDLNYIVASCKAWHKPAFERLKSEVKANWLWVTTPQELLAAVNHCSLRYIFFLHWNWHVPKDIWSPNECVCFHMTDLPYGRGGSPLQNLIVAGHKKTQLTALRMVEEMDAGPVYAKRPLLLEGRAEDIYRSASKLSFDIIRWIIANGPEPVSQVGEVVAFKRRKPEQSVLPLDGTLEILHDHIRMLDAETYPLAFIEHGGFRLEFSKAELRDDEIIAKVTIRKINPLDTDN